MQPLRDLAVKNVRAAVLREWFALPPEQRATQNQAAIFARQAMRAHGMPTDEDSIATVKGWLERYTGPSPIF